jgi:hypothetical protein
MSRGKKKVPHDDRTYDIGYGKPPEHTRFQPGQSGNPRGRPKGHKDWTTILTKLLNKKVRPTLNGKETPMTMQEMILQSILLDSARGKAGAQRIFLKLKELQARVDSGPPEGTHGVLVVSEVEKDEEKWSRRAVADHEALRKHFGLPPLRKPADEPVEDEADKPTPQGPKVRVRVVPGKKIKDGT